MLTTYHVSDELKSGSTFVEDGSIVKDESGHVALGVYGVKVHSRGRGARSLDHLLGLDVDTGSNGGDERGGTAGSGSVIELGHLFECRVQWCS